MKQSSSVEKSQSFGNFHPGSDELSVRRQALYNTLPESRGWNPGDVDELLTQASVINAPADTIILKPDTVCGGFIILLEGTVRVYQNASDGREITLYRTEPGGVCIMSLNSLLKNKRFNAVARAETPIRAMSLTRRQFMNLLGKDEAFATRVLSSITEHFSKTLVLMEELVFSRLESRLACLLGSMFEANGGVAIKATHQELANELGSTREVVSRILKNLEQQGCIVLARGKISLSADNSATWFEKYRSLS
ncbi:MAG: Crp/Fnr family transcriptional regulator [Acidiferrobacterales bacterium]